MKALVIGGTGPTGPGIVRGLCERGFDTTILHSGAHEPPGIPEEVEHLHSDAYDPEEVARAIEGRTFDLALVTYGRLRRNAEILRGRVGRFLSIGGFPGYRGYMNAPLFEPAGMPLPTREDGPRVVAPEQDEKGFRVARTEELVFDAQPDATHFRYPWVYGPRQPAPREWSIVRRILDGRRRIVLADGGLSLSHFGYVENLAHAVLLAVDQPEKSMGQVYNCGDQHVFTLRQVVDTIASAMRHDWEVVSMPWELALPARPLVAQPWTHHRVVSTGKIESELGYRDLVAPKDALAKTADWLAANRPEPGGIEEIILQDPFDYVAEDQLIDRYLEALSRIEIPEWREGNTPGYGLAYSGPGARPRSQPVFR